MNGNDIRIRLCTLVAVGVLAVGLTAVSVRADWDPVYDPAGNIVNHKMHYPQLPDLFGWDVNATYPKVLADDWQCSQTGPVTDVHVWGSWRQEQPYPIQGIELSIHSDVPADPTVPGSYSHPGELLWDRLFLPGQWQERVWPESGAQGWFDPNTGVYVRPDHFRIWQYNFVDILEPFVQEKGKVYWLDVSVLLPSSVGPLFGWKTSLNHFNDGAVWADFGTVAPNWRELRDPVTGQSLDLAFVITPEPGTLLLLLAGGLAMIRRRG